MLEIERNAQNTQETIVLSVVGAEVFRGAQSVLGPIDLHIAKGEHWVVFGPNGCGKSTLLALLSGRVWPRSGQVALLGSTLGRADIRTVRRLVGRVDYQLQLAFQQSAYPVEEVVCSGFFDSIGYTYRSAEDTHRRAATRALALLGSESLQFKVFRELSYGEQKRVLLARALVHEPQVLLLDEACEGLDVLAKQAFLQAVAQLLQEKPHLATLWSTHHLDEVSSATQYALLLDSGAVAFCGAVDDAFTEERLTALFGATMQVVLHKEKRYLIAGRQG